MTIAHTNVTSDSLQSTANTTSYPSTTAGQPSANAKLLAWVVAPGTVAAAPTFTGHGVVWTLEASIPFNAGADTLYLFTAWSGDAPTSTVCTFDCTGDAATGCIFRVQEVTGGDWGPLVQIVKSGANQTSANPAITLAALQHTNDNLVVFAFGSSGVAAPLGTPEAGSWAEKLDVDIATPTTALYIESNLSSADNTAVVTAATTLWAGIAIEIGPAGYTATQPQHRSIARIARSRVRSGPPLLLKQTWPDYTAPPGTITNSVDTPGAITLAGQAIGASLADAGGAGAITLAGQTVGQTFAQGITAGAITLAGQAVSATQSQGTTAGAVTLAGSAIGQTFAEGITAGQVTLAGQVVGITIDVPRASAIMPHSPRIRSPISLRGPPVLLRQRFPDYTAPSANVTQNVDTPGAISLAGQAVGLVQSQPVTAGSITLAGSAVSSKLTEAASAGALTLAGSTVGSVIAQPITAGAVTLAGSAVAATQGQGTTAGAVTLAGQAIGQTFVQGTVAGAITLAGQDLAGLLVTPQPSPLFQHAPRIRSPRSLKGPPILLRQTFPSYAAGPGITNVDTPGAVVLAGQTVNQVISISPGSLTLAGSTIGTAISAQVGAGAVTLAGSPVGATLSQPVTAGAVTLAGQAVASKLTQPAAAGAVTLAGSAVASKLTQPIAAGALALAGQTVVSTLGQPIAAGAVTLAGRTVAFTLGTGVVAGSLVLTGSVVAFGPQLSLDGRIAAGLVFSRWAVGVETHWDAEVRERWEARE